MTDNIDQQIRERIHAVFPDPQTAARVVDIVVHKKPLGWSRKSNAPYYGEIYANQIKVDIDKMIESGQSFCYRYSTWCTDTGMSQQTLYNRVNQSIRYLIEQMDTSDRKYDKWYRSVDVNRERGIGIVVSFKVGMREGAIFSAESIQPRDGNTPKWKQRMEDWLESDSTRPFCEEHLALTPEEVVELTTDLAKLTNIAASVTGASVKIIRTG